VNVCHNFNSATLMMLSGVNQMLAQALLAGMSKNKRCAPWFNVKVGMLLRKD